MAGEAILEDLKAMVKKMMATEGVSEYELKIEGQSNTWENYMGIIIFFQVLSKDGEKVYNLVMKTAKRSEEFRKAMKPEAAYAREIFMYSEVFPTFRKFTEEVNHKVKLDIIPKCYCMCAENLKETLILENLKRIGYRLHERKNAWNLEHSLLTMKEYGNYHGISFALRDRKPEIFGKLTRNMTNVYSELENFDIHKYYKDIMDNIRELLRNAGRDDLVEKYIGFENHIIRTLYCGAEEIDRLVITHGDCWNNNFMFKYQDGRSSKPSKICFLDFQASSLESPVRDLSYNIYSSCDKSLLNQLDLLLETYYASLSSTIRALGSNPEELFTYEQLQQHWKKYSKFGAIVSTFAMKGLLVNADDAPDIAKLLSEGKKIEDFTDIGVDTKEYDRRILEVYTHYGETVL